ncbi:protein translocase subunit SecF [Pelotomaculum isophthalicicum JI]|uniref:Protein-export membrane protein SecF n=1 Tax=Pelotomaculum isophthalicicum JI TaxID=947010 RepID=A0A9X4JW69_9FIRM|nr:protein translocase subunit SecF [Pelotomaculum isophthalicicum]MDF9408682.1 protein translocase subunit SecF [Pelotomaculum isophthalicicum JI]
MLRDKKPFHFIKLRKIWYVISILVIVPGIISLFSQGLNLGIDFRGGSLLDLRFNQPTEVEQVRGVLADFGLEGASIQRSGETDFLIRTRELTEDENLTIVQNLDQKLGGVTVQRNERVGPVIGQELLRKALLALGVASILMVVYIAWRFEFKQGIAAIIALLHDTLVILGIFSIFQIEVDSTFVAAVLTIIGYSINDTIVIFDRIRENMHNRKKGEVLEDIINNSLWQTLARSINTVLTVILVLVALFLLGGATIHNMVLALLIGVSSGAYSSIFNASPLWYDFKKVEERSKPRGARA